MTRPPPNGPHRPRRDPAETHRIDYRGPWVIVDLDDHWQAVYDLAPQGAEIVITAVRIQPRVAVPAGGLTTRVTRTLHPPLALRLFRQDLAQHLTPRSMSSEAQAAAAVVLAAGALRAHLVPTGLSSRDADAYLRSGAVTPEAADEALALFMTGKLPGQEDVTRMVEQRWAGWDAGLVELERAARRPARDRLGRLAETAALYVKARAENAPAPNQRVATIQGRSGSKVRDDLRAARRAGLLTETPGRGRAGGTLTDKARAILRPH